MFAFSRIMFFIGLLVISQGYASSAEPFELVEPDEKASPPADSLFVFRTIIQTAIMNLQNVANIGNQLLNNLATVIQQQQNAFLQTLNSNIAIVNQNIQNAVNQILNSGQNTSAAVIACINETVIAAQKQNNQTVIEIRACIDTTVAGLQTIVTNGRALVQSANALATDISNKVQACGTANWSNWMQVNNCLNGVWNGSQAQINSLLAQIASANANALIVIVTVPANLAICGGSSILNAASNIISNINRCATIAIQG